MRLSQSASVGWSVRTLRGLMMALSFAAVGLAGSKSSVASKSVKRAVYQERPRCFTRKVSEAWGFSSW